MNLVLLQDNKLFREKEGFVVGGKKIKALSGYLTLTEKEKEKINETSAGIWNKLMTVSGAKEDFKGIVRFDFAPCFSGKAKKTSFGYDLGEVGLKALYEVNAHSTEDFACDALHYLCFPEISSFTPFATRRVAREVVRQVGRKIFMVKGDGVAKDSWIEPLLKELSATELSVEVVSPREVMKNNLSPLWRWGDVDLEGEFREFDDHFQKWLLEKQEKREVEVFNTLPENRKKDVANKGHLAEKGEEVLYTKDALERALLLDKDRHLVKPLRGASGNGIVFGDELPLFRWKKFLSECFAKQNYGVFKKKLLPRVSLEKEDVVLDILPVFFAQGRVLHPLYCVARIAPWESYLSEGRTINVVKGGGYAGTVAVSEG